MARGQQHPRGLERAAAALAVVAVLVAAGCSSEGSAAPAAEPEPADPTSPVSPPGATSEVACAVTDREPAPAGSTWEHPEQSFYTGAEDALPQAADLEHLLRADAAAVVRYDPSGLPVASIEALRTWAEHGEAVVALPAEASAGAASAPLVVDVLDEQLSCDGLDTFQLDAFVAGRDTGDVDAH